MNKVCKFAVMLPLALMAAAGARADMGTGTITSSTRDLNGGMIYTVQGNVSIPAEAGKNALTVKSGSEKRVVIYIPAGCSLSVTGGVANASTPGGAGIYLPGDMSLYITGKGKLTATGGAAGTGGNGADGNKAEWSDVGDNHHKNGGGGNGGAGGGGAGAGIGGSGGQGGNGGSGAPRFDDWQYSYHGRSFPKDGANGSPGPAGAAGAAGGNVYLLGDVAVTVRGGASVATVSTFSLLPVTASLVAEP